MDTSKLEKIVEGAERSVFLTAAVNKAFAKVDAKARARICRVMEHFVRFGPAELNRENYIFEKRIQPKGGQKAVPVYAFKGWQVRVYGSVESVGGMQYFLGTEIDVSKKQNKADPECIQRAANKFHDLIQ